MLEGLVATVLNRVLGSYVENFDPKQLNIGLLSGDVKLTDLALKREALDKLHLPIDVVNGRIGSLVLQIPYSNFKSKPLRIVIEDVSVLAKPDMSGSDDEGQLRRQLVAKLDKLDLWEVAEATKREEQQKTKGDPAQQQTYMGNLVSRILDNIQITIKNIHVRFEDGNDVPGHSFATGFKLGELSAVSTDKHWEPAFIVDATSISHKLLTLDSLSLYWDTDARLLTAENQEISRFELAAKFEELAKSSDTSTQYLLRPVNGLGYVTLDSHPTKESNPKINADLQFEEFGFGLNKEQYRDMLVFGDAMQLYFRMREYRKIRPTRPPKEDPLAWFQYAAKVVLSNVEEKRRRWTWDYQKKRIEDGRRYRALYKALQTTGGLTTEERADYDDLERQYEYSDLVLFRSLAKQEIRRTESLEKAKNAMSQAQNTVTKSWSSWWWGTPADPAKTEQAQDPENVMPISEQDKRDLLEALELDDPSLHSDDSLQQVLLQAEVSLYSGSLRLQETSHPDSPAVSSLKFNGVRSKFIKRPDSATVSLSMDSLEISDLTAKSQFPTVVQVQRDALKTVEHNNDSDMLEIATRDSPDKAAPLLWVRLEQNPANKVASSSLYLKLRSVEVVYNARFLDSIISFLKPPSGRNQTMEAIISAANHTVEELREQTRAGLEYALSEHKTVSMHIDIAAPIIIVPMDPMNRDGPTTIVDAGNLTISSELVKKEVLDEVKSKQAQKYSDSDWQRLESLMYDRFNISLHDTQILVGKSFDECIANLGHKNSDCHIIEKTNLEFRLEISIVPKTTSIPRCRMTINLPELKINMADVQYKTFMTTIDNTSLQVHFDDDLSTSKTAEELFYINNDFLAPRETRIEQSFQRKATERVHSDSAASQDGSGQRQFELELVLNTAELSLTRDWERTPVVKGIIQMFGLDLSIEANSMSLAIAIQDLILEDPSHGSASLGLRRIMESEMLAKQEKHDGYKEARFVEDIDEKTDLITVELQRSTANPVTELSVGIVMNPLRLVLTPKTIVTLYDYIMSTFTSPESPVQLADEETVSEELVTSKIHVQVTLEGVSALLNDEDIVMSRLDLTKTEMFVDVLGPHITFRSVLGGIFLTDKMDSSNSALQRVITMEGDQNLLEFRYETWGPVVKDQAYNTEIFLRSGSMVVCLVKEPIQRLIGFFSKFTQMKVIYDQGRTVADDQAIQFESADKIKFDILIKAPHIVHPRIGEQVEVLKICPGEITLNNTFDIDEVHPERVLNSLTARLHNVKIATGLLDENEKRDVDLLKNADLQVNLSYANAYEGIDRPLLLGESSFSITTIDITQYQYLFIYDLVDTLTEISQDLPGLPETEAGQLRDQVASQKHLNEAQQQAWHDQAKASQEASKPQIVADKVDFKFAAPAFTVNLFNTMEPVCSHQDLNSSSLTEFKLNGLKADLSIDKSEFLEFNLGLKSFTVTDTRLHSKNKFPELIPAALHNDYQLLCRVTRAHDEPPHIDVSFDSPKIILAFDYLNALKLYFTIPESTSPLDTDLLLSESSEEGPVIVTLNEDDNFDPETGSVRVPTLKKVQNEPAAMATKPPFTLMLNVVDPHLIILAEPDDENSEAIVFKISKVYIDSGLSATVQISKVGIYFTRMANFESAQLRILDDFNIDVQADNLVSNDIYHMMKVSVHVDLLVLHLSLRDILLAMKIAETASSLLATGDDHNSSGSARAQSYLSNGRKVTQELKHRDSAHSERATSRSIESIRVSGEVVTVELEGIRLVLIEPDNQIPIADISMDALTARARNWSSSLRADAQTEFTSSIYNFSKSAWEPLVDRLDLGLNVAKREMNASPTIEIYSRKIIDFELTQTTLSVVEHIQAYFAAEHDLKAYTVTERDQTGQPYRIHNRTGFDLHVWFDNPGQEGSNDEVVTVKDGETEKWFFHDWRFLRKAQRKDHVIDNLSLGVELLGTDFADVRGVVTNLVGENIYLLKHQGLKTGDAEPKEYRLSCEIYMEGYLKHIVFRSTMEVINNTNLDLEICVMPTPDTDVGEGLTMIIKPGEDYALPLRLVGAKIFVRPTIDAYGWSRDSVSWLNLRNHGLPLVCSQPSGPSFIIHAEADYFQDIPLKKQYPYMRIVLSSSFEIINNLPYEISYRLHNRDTKENWEASIKESGNSHIHTVRRDNFLLLGVKIEGTSYAFSQMSIVNSQRSQIEREESMTMSNSEGHRLKLSIRYFEFPQKRGMAIVISSPYVVLNGLGKQLMISTRTNEMTCAVHEIAGSQSTQKQARPALWSFDSSGASDKAMIRVDNSRSSDPISFAASGRVAEVPIKSHNGQLVYKIGIHISEGEGRHKLTRIIHIAPRFMVCNSLTKPIRFGEPKSLSPLGELQPGEHRPVEFVHPRTADLLCLSFTEPDSVFSNPIVMSNTGTTYVRVQEHGKPTTLIKVDIILEHATLFIQLTDAKDRWPYSIRNLTDLTFTFYQVNPNIDDDGVERDSGYIFESSGTGYRPVKYSLPPYSVMPYSWDFPASPDKEIVLQCGHKKRKIQLAEIGELPPAKFTTPTGHPYSVDLNVIAEELTQALIIAPFEAEESNYDMVEPYRTQSNISSNISSATSVMTDNFRPAEFDDDQPTLNIELRLKGLGVSYISRSSQEICYATFRHLTVRYRLSDIYRTLSWQCQWIQIDNALAANTDYPVLLYPSIIPKTGEEMKQHPTFSGSITEVCDDSYGLTYIKHATLLLQELTIEVDEDLVMSLLGMMSTPSDQIELLHDESARLCSQELTIPKPAKNLGNNDIYFEMLHLQPIQLNLSFARTGALSETPIFAELTGAMSYVIDALTMALGNINDAPVKFGSLLMENVRATPVNLGEAVQTHYSQQLLHQIHRIVGSVDVLGSPIGLFNNISSGVLDLFYEPYNGYILTDRPQDIGIGLAKGGASFLKKSVFGLSDSFAKFTGSLSKGLLTVTMDPAFQKEQRSQRTRNHPRHALYGVSIGATSLANSLASGITGLARAPIQGAATSGASGFFRGLGKGLVGLPTKTAVGLLEFASNVGEGVRNTTTIFDGNAIERARLPRVMAPDGIVRVFNERDAVGQALLHTVDHGSFSRDSYLAHTPVTVNKTILVSYQRLLFVDVTKLTLEWQIPYRDLRTVVLETGGLSLELADDSRGPFIPLGDASTRKYIYNKISIAVTKFNQRRHLLY